MCSFTLEAKTLTNSERDCVYLQHCGFLNSVHSYDMFYTRLVVCDIAGKSYKKVKEKGKQNHSNVFIVNECKFYMYIFLFF